MVVDPNNVSLDFQQVYLVGEGRGNEYLMLIQRIFFWGENRSFNLDQINWLRKERSRLEGREPKDLMFYRENREVFFPPPSG